jgi:3-phenylpropionate/cinnamic acid dioxygenase small subunit
MNAPAPLDPSRSSYYVSDALYRELIENFSGWQDDAQAITDVSIMFDDRRRLEDRVYRLRTGFAWSQAPASRTVRLITNVEVFGTVRDDARMLRSNFLISEFWGDETRVLTGWAGYRLLRDGTGWKIQAKQVNLIDCDQCIRNPSIIL